MQDNKFKERHLKETKHQNQILKQAISKLQIQFVKIREKAGDTFLTQADHQDGESIENKVASIEQILEKLKNGDFEGVQNLGKLHSIKL